MSRNLLNKAKIIGQKLVEMYAWNIAEDIAEARGSSWKVAFVSLAASATAIMQASIAFSMAIYMLEGSYGK